MMPPGWLQTTLSEVADVATGKTPPTSDATLFGGDVPFVRPGDLDGPRDLVATGTTLTLAAFDHVPRLPAGSVLVSCIGNLGKTAILSREGACNQQINAILPTPLALPEFLYAWARTLRAWLEENSSATTIDIINKGRFLNAPIALPPLPEQRRIVAKLEALTAQSRKAKEALDAIPPLIEQFRQSVLAAAFRGDLTAAWREKNPEVEPAEKLLTRIRAERRKRWEEGELAKMRAKGKAPGDDRWKEKYEEPEPVDTEGLPELPEGWCWTTLGCLADIINGDRGKDYPSQSEYVSQGLPFINAGHIRADGTLSAESMHYITRDKFDSLGGGKIRARDLVYCLRGTLGKTAFVAPFSEGAIASSLVIVRPDDERCSRYLYYFLVSPSGRAEIEKYDNGSAQPNLSASSLSRYLVPVPPQREMQAICDLLRDNFDRMHAVSGGMDRLSAMVFELDRSILAKAFRGELVPQDPTDEPASVLLERIRAERSAAPAAKKKDSKRAPRR